ncbi:MAG TPA: NADP-dependent oxidoreductase [Actinomycetaceae bacterium]|nr:NADP-dependent oxidoreductase [Actinomycetaceae bacterium]
MRAVVVPRNGGPEVLEVVTLPDRHAGPGQVRIRVAAATVNPTDLASRAYPRGQAPTSEEPLVLGMEAAGTIDEVGEGVTGLAVGDEVIAIAVPSSETGGAYREDLVVDAEQVAPKPAGLDMAHAATIPMNGLTAQLALDMLDLGEGEDLVVSGAAGALGGYVCQLAAHRGLRVVAIGSDTDRDLLASLGAHEFVERGDGVAQRVREVLPEGAHGAVDAALLHEELLPAVRDGGGFAVVRGWDGDVDRGITVHKVMVTRYSHRTEKLTELVQLTEAGTLTTRVAQTYPIAQAPEAHRRMEAGGVRGRLVLTF